MSKEDEDEDDVRRIITKYLLESMRKAQSLELISLSQT